jgi:hypothetical protein
MRYRLMATYRGVPYEAGMGPSGGDVVLFAACPPPEELGFEPATGHWRKRVIRAEVDAVWESRPVGTFRGEPCLVLDDLGDRLHIAYLGGDGARATQLGYWQVDRDVYELLTPRDDVTGLTEERVEKPLLQAPPPAPVPGNGYPYLASSIPPPSPPEPSLPQQSLPEPSLREPSLPEPSLREPSLREPSLPELSLPRPPAPRPSPPGPPRPGPAESALAGPAPAQPALPEPALPEPALPERLLSGPSLPEPPPATRESTGGRSARRQRVPTRDIFIELADMAGIPRTAYALETEADGAMCLLPSSGGFEVFMAADGARHEVRFFPDEETAYFYLFGVLAAEAIRNGVLAPLGATLTRSGL